jgi:hypothetical protein
VKRTGEFTSLEEPTNNSDIAANVVFSADGSDFVGSERQVVPKDPTRKLRHPIAKTGVRVGG